MGRGEKKERRGTLESRYEAGCRPSARSILRWWGRGREEEEWKRRERERERGLFGGGVGGAREATFLSFLFPPVRSWRARESRWTFRWKVDAAVRAILRRFACCVVTAEWRYLVWCCYDEKSYRRVDRGKVRCRDSRWEDGRSRGALDRSGR